VLVSPSSSHHIPYPTLTIIQNIVEDIYILLLPISTVLHLHMSTRRKIAVLGVIAFGSSSVIIACFRLIPLLELNSTLDVSWVLGKMIIVAALEIQFAVVAVNLPSLKALWMRYTGGSSAGTGPDKSNSRGYKLSDMDGKGGGMSKGRATRSKGSRGSITRLERGMSHAESEEELVRRNGEGLHVPVQGVLGDMGTIKVTKNFEVRSTRQDRGLAYVAGEEFVGRQ
jgi:hypothetical protein